LALQDTRTQLAIKDLTFSTEMKRKLIESEHSLMARKAFYEKEISFLKNLKEVGSDISKYLVYHAGKPDEIIGKLISETAALTNEHYMSQLGSSNRHS